MIRALLRLGKTCVTDVSGLTLNRAEHIGVELHQLDRAGSSTRHKYLDQGRSGKYIFLYHAMTSQANVHVFALFTPSGPVRLHLVDPATHRQAIPRLQEKYTTLREQRSSNGALGSSFTYPSQLDFTSSYHQDDKRALRAISKELGFLENQGFTVVISSIKEQSYFDNEVKKLAKFPVLSTPKAKTPHTLFDLVWQKEAADKLLSRYLAFGTWLDRTIALADYYDVPIGHVDGDQPLLLADINFGHSMSLSPGFVSTASSIFPPSDSFKDAPT